MNFRQFGCVAVATATLSGCVMGKGGDAAVPLSDDAVEAGVIATDGTNPITGDAIAATSIDAAPILASPGDGGAPPVAETPVAQTPATQTPVAAHHSRRRSGTARVATRRSDGRSQW